MHCTMESVELDESSDIINKNSEVLSENNENNEDRNISEDLMSCLLTTPELFTFREKLFKSKSKDDDIYKGPKLYYPSDCTASEEIVEDIMQDNQKSLKLQRIAKNKDCLKAEWNEECKVAVVPYLKGKAAQHIGITVNGKCVLSPEEALFLLEKCVIEVEHNKMPLSVEEAHSLMLKGKLAVEKFQVYTHLSQQGFIVVHHQSRIGPNYLKVMNLTKKRKRKRKAEESSELPDEKRLTFSGVFTSNLNSLNVENNFSGDCLLSNDASSVNEKFPSDTLRKSFANEKMDVDLSNNDLLSSNTDGIDSHASLDRETISNNVISSNVAGIDSSHTPLDKETNMSCFKEQTNQDDHVKELSVSTKDSESAVISSYIGVKDKEDKIEKACEKINEIDNNEIEINDNENEFSVTNTNKNIDIEGDNINEIDVENINKESVGNDNDDGDTNEVIIEDEQKSDINVEDSGSGYDDNEESESTDESIPIVYENSNEESLDVYSCSPSDHQANKDLNIETNNLISKPFKDQDEEITLVRVMKKEKKPLAVIDLLSDEEDCDMLSSNAKKTQNETNGRKFEDSDEEIEVLDEVSGTNNIKESSYRSNNFIKLESRKLKTESSEVKTAFNSQMKFPELFKADMACITRPAIDHVPIRCQPAKELYVINIKKSSQPRSNRLWNSYRDMQEYQRERHRDKQRNSFVPRTSCTYNNTFSNVPPPFSSSEYFRDNGVNRNHDYPIPTNKSFYQPMNSERGGGLLPTPDTFSSPNHLPFSMNIHNFQNLSATNPAAFVNEVQKTVYSVASNMISTILGQHLNPNNSNPASSPAFNDSTFMNFNPHHNNFSASPRMPNQMAYNSSGRNDFPIRFPPESAFSGERHPFSANENPFLMENVWRHSNNFRQRNYPPRGPSFPCMYRAVRKKKNWNDVKAAVVGTNSSGSECDIEEVPINFNRFLYSNEIKPLVDPGTKLPVADGLKSLKLIRLVNLCDKKQNVDRYLPTASTLEISFDVYLPNTKYKRSEPGVPNYRILVVKASDPIPRYSELINLQRKLNDGAVLQVAIVDHGDISFYSFNSVNIQELVPFDSVLSK